MKKLGVFLLTALLMMVFFGCSDSDEGESPGNAPSPTLMLSFPSGQNFEYEGNPVNVPVVLLANAYGARVENYAIDCDSDGVWDGQSAIPSFTCTYDTPGGYKITARMIDEFNRTATASEFVVIQPSAQYQGVKLSVEVLPPTPTEFRVAFSVTSDYPAGYVAYYAYDCDSDGNYEYQGQNTSYTCTYPKSDAGKTKVGTVAAYNSSHVLLSSASATFSLAENHAPTISSVTVDPQSPKVPGTVTVTISASDEDGDSLTYYVDCTNDGTWEYEGNSPTYSGCSYDAAGNYTVKVKVSDSNGGEATRTAPVNPVENVPPEWTVSFEPSDRHVNVGANLTITVTETQSLDGDHIDRYSYDCDSDGTWEAEDVAQNTYTCTYPAAGTYYVKVRIKDTGGSVDEKGGNGVADYDVTVTAGGGGGSAAAWTALKTDNDANDQNFNGAFRVSAEVPDGVLVVYTDGGNNKYAVFNSSGGEVASDDLGHGAMGYSVRAVATLLDDPLPDGATTQANFALLAFRNGTHTILDLRNADNLGGDGDWLLSTQISNFTAEGICSFLPVYDPDDTNKVLYRVILAGQDSTNGHAAFVMVTLSYNLSSGEWLVLDVSEKELGFGGFGGMAYGCLAVRNFSNGRSLYVFGRDAANVKGVVYKYSYQDLVADFNTAAPTANYETSDDVIFYDAVGIGVETDGDFENLILCGKTGANHGYLLSIDSALDTVNFAYEESEVGEYYSVVHTSDSHKVVVVGWDRVDEPKAVLYDVSSTPTVLYDYVANDSESRLHGSGNDAIYDVIYTDYGYVVFVGETDSDDFNGAASNDQDVFVTHIPLNP